MLTLAAALEVFYDLWDSELSEAYEEWIGTHMPYDYEDQGWAEIKGRQNNPPLPKYRGRVLEWLEDHGTGNLDRYKREIGGLLVDLPQRVAEGELAWDDDLVRQVLATDWLEPAFPEVLFELIEARDEARREAASPLE